MFCNYNKKLTIHKKDVQTFIIIVIDEFIFNFNDTFSRTKLEHKSNAFFLLHYFIVSFFINNL